jgi:hypothetical protein
LWPTPATRCPRRLPETCFASAAYTLRGGRTTMLETLLPIWGIGALVVWWQRREARRLGIPWSTYLKMTPAERKKAGVRL